MHAETRRRGVALRAEVRSQKSEVGNSAPVPVLSSDFWLLISAKLRGSAPPRETVYSSDKIVGFSPHRAQAGSGGTFTLRKRAASAS